LNATIEFNLNQNLLIEKLPIIGYQDLPLKSEEWVGKEASWGSLQVKCTSNAGKKN
jgi:hypothetical protein